MAQPPPSPTIHGLDYPAELLAGCPVLLERPAPHTPIRAISAPAFAAIHTVHLTAHAPDHVLFPFLHGLEGDNDAQNRFFGVHAAPPRAPRFRGLVWVAADEPLGTGAGASPAPEPATSDDDDDDDVGSETGLSDISDDGEQRDTFGLGMDVDADSAAAAADPNLASHMHPVAQRTYGTGHDRRASDAASSVASSIPSLFSARGRSFSTASTAPTAFSPPSSPKAGLGSLADALHAHEHEASPPRALAETLPHFTSTFRARELLRTDAAGGLVPEFLSPKIPAGISLRNFGIQVPIYATISDVVVYSVRGDRAAARALAGTFKLAIEAKAAERVARTGAPVDEGVPYSVFVLDAAPDEVKRHLGHILKRVIDETHEPHTAAASPACVQHPTLPSVEGLDTVDETRPLAHPTGLGLRVDTRAGKPVLHANTIDFAQREKEEMRELTRASEIFSLVPGGDDAAAPELAATTTATHWDPLVGQLFLGHASDVPLPADGPGPAGEGPLLRPTLSARASLADMERPGARAPALAPEPDEFGFGANDPALGRGWDVCIECHDCAPFPNSAHVRAAEEHLARLDTLWAAKVAREGRTGAAAVRPPPRPAAILHLPFPSSPPNTSVTVGALGQLVAFLERALAPVGIAPATSALGGLHPDAATGGAPRTRPLKILVFSADGYTESSVLALALLMALRGLALPDAYLTLQCEKRRSFYVYGTDLGVLRRVEARCAAQREQRGRVVSAAASALGLRRGSVGGWASPATPPAPAPETQPGSLGRTGGAMYVPVSAGAGSGSLPAPQTLPTRRARASTSPRLPSVFGDHQMWFADPRFDGSFPSRVLPFLYLGNLNHASNAYMLHALGITHVVSVGECALVPPPGAEGGGAQLVAGAGPGRHGSLWIEERAGRISVLDIRGVCDDGIDTLAPELGPACEWIDRARAGGGTVLVHCRVGVSRSATLVIAYVMQHAGLSLVDAYLLVRSRRLSVLIQPNMRLLYNLLGWEIKLARERAGGNDAALRAELARGLSWPYLAKEVHALNEKYLS